MKFDFCDLCRSKDLISVYSVEDSRLDLGIYVCKNCSLCQSLPRIETVGPKKKIVSTTGGAGWGNIRYGKGFRADHNINFINRHNRLAEVDFPEILDIGSNRAEFFKKLIELYPDSSLTGVEPDKRLNHEYTHLQNCNLVNERIENLTFDFNSFDLIYSSHTFEHISSPYETLKNCYNWLKHDGLIYLEVPNLLYINNTNLIDEFFIDKHLYHFTEDTFFQLVLQSGFSILESEVEDRNICVLAQKSMKNINLTNSYNNLNKFDSIVSSIKSYSDSLKNNIANLVEVSKKIELLAKTNMIVFWGAGRIFHSLVRYGNLSNSTFKWLIDSYLSKYVNEVYGIKILNPEEIKDNHKDIKPDYVIICSKAFALEIELQVNKIFPLSKTINLLDMLDE